VSCDRVVQELALLPDVPRLLPVGVMTPSAAAISMPSA